jgi:3-mercaptopyruvate sulfurtransferase SseA
MQMRVLAGFVIVLVAALAAPAPMGAQDTSSAELRIQWAEFKKAYDAKRVVVVDVRGQDAYDAGHIPGSISVPLDDVEKRAGELKKTGKPIVLYCS